MNEFIGFAVVCGVAIPVTGLAVLLVKIWPAVANFVESFINLHSKLDCYDLSKKDEP